MVLKLKNSVFMFSWNLNNYSSDKIFQNASCRQKQKQATFWRTFQSFCIQLQTRLMLLIVIVECLRIILLHIYWRLSITECLLADPVVCLSQSHLYCIVLFTPLIDWQFRPLLTFMHRDLYPSLLTFLQLFSSMHNSPQLLQFQLNVFIFLMFNRT